MNDSHRDDWRIYDPDAAPLAERRPLPEPPPWRRPGAGREAALAETLRPHADLVDAVNTALYLRRPLLVTGKPGTGKSSLIYAVARQLALGPVIEWAINSRSVLQDGLYLYDALARLQYIQQQQAWAASAAPASASASGGAPPGAGPGDEARELGMFITLGPLGSALASPHAPRALLVDEIDKSDVDLPNDLLNIIDTGRFAIPELKRAAERHPRVTVSTRDGESVEVVGGEVTFEEYPFIVMTSNGEREFPAPFLRRCVQCQIPEPGPEELKRIVAAHFGDALRQDDLAALVDAFVRHRDSVAAATDQLLNAVHLLGGPDRAPPSDTRERVLKTVFQNLG